MATDGMPGGKTRGYYLPLELIAWLEREAESERRSVSGLLATIVEREKRDAEQRRR